MYCNKCGTQNPDDAIFCSKCGNELGNVNSTVSNNMPDSESKNEKTKKITLGLILSWIFGVLFGLSGIGLLIQGSAGAGIPLILISIVILPPINSYIEKKFNFSLSRGLRITVVIILFVVYGANLPDTDTQLNDGQPSTTSSIIPAMVGSYESPASVGETLVFESSGKTFDVLVTEVVRGKVLNDDIATENMFNDDPPSGYEYAAVKVQIKYSAGKGSESYLGSPFSAFSEGIELDDARVVTPKKYPELSTGEFMPGATKTGWVFFTVPQNKDVLIRFKPNPFIDNSFYVNIGST